MALTHLIDRSATAREHHPAVAMVIDELIDRQSVATTPIIDLELLYSARSGPEWTLHRGLRQAYEIVDLTPRAAHRAIEVQGALWCSGRVRAVGIAGLLIAAVAEEHGLTVLHYDSDFDTIAAVTGQSCRWVVPAGSVP